MKVLIIEDEPELAKSMLSYLKSEQYKCEWAESYHDALEKIYAFDYECILLDIGLPDGNGLHLLQILKEMNKQDGVIIISAKDSLEDKIRGLQIGADDYLTKPFHLSELTARMYSIIRRSHFSRSNTTEQGPLRIDLLSKNVTVNNREIQLTKKEYDLLIYFIGNKERVISKSTLAEHLSGDLADMLDNYDFVYAHVKNLKKKLYEAGCERYLKTVYGTGYKWIDQIK
ncbi:response regulator transcription factor [Sphingobacterium sp. lm-10]|uniref:response regulator transcription factor n=1 Tax=Sphingobacterium sp. lm-10 TaxID=2944904 RepID=UPI0020207620|nr:response regulator transcription factor [Sphingobacterium sp. lm-10]MCL7989071.1 response regulator transcription factor [Sphingobacterium sp. lm-10]